MSQAHSTQCKPGRSADDFLKELEEANVTVAQWCRENSLSSGVVWAVIRGAVVGRSGEARRAMKLMKLPLPSARRTRTKPVTQMQEAA